MEKLNNDNAGKAILQKKPKVAVIGSGYWGKNLVRNHYEIGSLSMICDKNESVLGSFKEKYPELKTCIALSDILSNKNIDGIVIATPAETHYSIAREALLSDKHVYVEKPLVLHEEEGSELIEIAKKNNKVLMVGHLLQYHPVFQKLKDMVFQGELGRINYIYSHRLNLGKIRREENILWSFAPHDISMILSLATEEPESVITIGGYYLHKKIADVTTTHLEFSSGLRAHIFVSWLHPFKVQQLVVVGEKKMAVFDDTQPWGDKLLLYRHEIKWQGNVPVPEKAEPERLDIPEAEPLRVECIKFLESMENGQQPLTDGKEGLRVLKILNASQRSLDENGRKIQLYLNNTSAETVFKKKNKNSREKNFAHASSFIDENVRIGIGTKIWHFSHVLKGSIIGTNCNIGQNVVIGPDVKIGDNCKIQNNVSIYKGVTLEDNVFCGPSMVFTNVNNPRAEIRKMHQMRSTIVRKGATIGANATIVCGIEIGNYAFIGAGSVVIKDVKNYALVVGNPAVQKGWICWCGERLSNELKCSVCKRNYSFAQDGNLLCNQEV